MAASGVAKEAEIDDSELDQLIEEYKKLKDSGELKDLDTDFENHPFFMDHVPTVRVAGENSLHLGYSLLPCHRKKITTQTRTFVL